MGSPEGAMAAEPFGHGCDLHARPAANRDLRSIRRPETCSTQEDSSPGPDHRAYLGPAAAGQGEHSSFPARFVRSDPSCRRCFFDRVLGMASGAHHGPGNSDHAGHDFWRFVHVGNRPATGIRCDVDHSAGPVGRRTRCGRRWHQARPCRWLASRHRGMAWPDQAGDRNLFRNTDKYHRLPAFPYAHREYWRVS